MSKTVLILGIDGYIGWSLAIDLLTTTDYEIAGLDDGSRRNLVSSVGSKSLTPIPDIKRRYEILEQFPNFIPEHAKFHLDDVYLKEFLREIKPDIIVHLAEQPSAPFSMIDAESAIYSQEKNVLGTLRLLWSMREICPQAHLIKLGTMGEYGCPEVPIPEGNIHSDCPEGRNLEPCPLRGTFFPRDPGSFYHISKVQDTYNVRFACKTWGLSSTDIMQGIVYGLNDVDDKELLTRFDYDQYFGTVINRFCVQALAKFPLTVYGLGGQTRGFLPLIDSLECIKLIMKNPPKPGQYRTINQLADLYSIIDLAETISAIEPGCQIQHINNPRTDLEIHNYEVSTQTLRTFGYTPSTVSLENQLHQLLNELRSYTNQINRDVIYPTTHWR